MRLIDAIKQGIDLDTLDYVPGKKIISQAIREIHEDESVEVGENVVTISISPSPHNVYNQVSNAMSLAIYHGYANVINYLLKRGHVISDIDLIMAIRVNNVEIINEYLPNIITSLNRIPIIEEMLCARRFDLVDNVRQMGVEFVPTNYCDIVSRCGDIDAIKYLQNCGCQINDFSLEKALLFNSNDDAIEYLINAGIDLGDRPSNLLKICIS